MTTPPSTAYRAVALDLDGTTLSSRSALTPRTTAAIRRADAAGVQVIIATGRQAGAVQHLIDELALPRPVPTVCYNGACAMMLGSGPAAQPLLLASRGLSRDTAVRVLETCEAHGWCASYIHAGGTAAAPLSKTHEAQLAAFEAAEGFKQERVASVLELLHTLDPPLKVVAQAEEPEAQAEQARVALPGGVAHILAAEMHIEFLQPGVSKGAMLVTLCEQHLGIDPKEVVAFGDSYNDMEMLQLIGHGVAMANAKEAVKKVADRVCRWTNDEEGVARELERLVAPAFRASSCAACCEPDGCFGAVRRILGKQQRARL